MLDVAMRDSIQASSAARRVLAAAANAGRRKRPVRSLPPSKPLTGPAPPRRSVCAPGSMSHHSIADQPRKGELTMSFNSWLQNLRSALAPGRGQRHHGRRGSLRAATHRPNLEVLEDRCLLSFSPAVSFPAGINPQAVVTADFNGDGRLDLATANAGDNTVSVLLGNANGTFQPAQNSATGVYPQSLAVGDFNADGKLDLATANTGDVSVLLGNGNGTFQAPANIGIGSDPA